MQAVKGTQLKNVIPAQAEIQSHSCHSRANWNPVRQWNFIKIFLDPRFHGDDREGIGMAGSIGKLFY